MKAKKPKNGIKVLLSLVIAIAMVMPISAIASGDRGFDNDKGASTTENSEPSSIVIEPTIPTEPTSTEPYAGGDPYGTFELVNESFESWPPAGWTVGLNWSQNTTASHTGDACAMRNATSIQPYTPYGGTTQYATLCVDVDATGMTSVSLVYWLTSVDGAGLSGDVEVDGTVVDSFTITTRYPDWESRTVDLSAYADTTFTLCFNYTDPEQDDAWLLDDVVVTGDNHPTGIDIAVNGLVNLTCGGRYNTAPKYIEASVANYGQTDADNVSFHFQIYKEVPVDPQIYQLWDMESCVLDTWIPYSWDGDWSTWTWTEKRANSPTHSWHTQPDSIDTYEYDSHDSLVLAEPFHIPDSTVSAAYLTFSHWCEGEFAGTQALDYGMVYITNGTYTYAYGPYYDTNGEWEDVEVDISKFIGDDIIVNFTWFSDSTMNYEGWYIDDVNIDLNFGALQPLIWSDYKYADLPAGTETVIKSQLPWGTIDDDANYYIQVYMADNYLPDVNLDNNEINCSVWFGDVCDAAITDVSVAPEVELNHSIMKVGIPINVTVYNNGTLAEDVPVEVKVNHIIKDTLFSDDFESGNVDQWTNAYSGDDTTGPTFIFHATDEDSNTGAYSAYFGTNGHYLAGMAQAALTPEITLPSEYNHIWFEYAAKYAFYDPIWGGYYTFSPIGWYYGIPIYYNTYQDVFMPILEDPTLNAFLGYWPSTVEGWQITGDNGPSFQNKLTPGAADNPYESGDSPNMYQVDITPWLEHYQALGYVQNSIALGWFLRTSTDGTALPWSGLMVDDVSVWYDKTGALVWSDTKTVHLEPGESKVITFIWNATDYCDYIVTATNLLDCDIDPTNDVATANTRIYEQLYEDNYDSMKTEDNTAGLPDNWIIAEECSLCPDNHFWWNENGTGAYGPNTDDVLQINETFNWTGASQVWLNFSTWFSVEEGWDFGLIEISNDSGKDWYVIDLINNNSTAYFGGNGWTDLSYELVSYINTLGAIGLFPPGYTFNPATFFTDQMQVRFRMWSDAYVCNKGWMIDNVNITVDGTTVFFDDMENATASADKWFHEQRRSGVWWHSENVFGAAGAPTADWFWDGDTTNSPYNCDPYNTYDDFITFWWDPHIPGDYIWDSSFWYSHYSNNEYRDNVDEKLIFTYDLTHAYQAFLTFSHNYSFETGFDYGRLEISTDGGSTWQLIKSYTGNSSGNWVSTGFDISKYAGGDIPVQIRFRVVSDDSVHEYGWLVDNVSINGKVDYQAPTISATLNPSEPNGNNDWYTSGVTVTLTASDNYKVGTVYYRINGGSWLVYTAPFTVTGDGSYVIDYYAVDSVGNVGSMGSVSFKIDQTAPTASISTPQAGYIYFFGRELMPRILVKDKALIIGGLNAEATASDALSGVYVVKFNEDGTTFAEDTSSPYSAPLPFALFKAHTLTVTAEDFAGNTYTTPGVDYFKIF